MADQVFKYTNESGKPAEINKNPEDLIAMRFQDPPIPWYDGSDKEKETIARKEGISWPRLTGLRRSPEFKNVVETFLEKNGHDVNEDNIIHAGWLDKKRSNAKRHPDSEKFVVWGKLVEETDDRIVIEKLPDVEDEHKGKTRRDLIAEIEAMKAKMAGGDEAPAEEAAPSEDAEPAEEAKSPPTAKGSPPTAKVGGKKA